MPGKRQLERKRTAKLFRKVLQNTLKIPERLTVSEWAEKYRNLGATSNFSGKWSNNLTPYLIEIMDAFTDRSIREINFVKSTQVGGTEAILNMLGYVIMESPAPTMLAYPTDELAKDLSKDRIIPSLTMTEEIKKLYNPKKSKQMAMKFRGMTLYATGAGNATKVSSKPIKYLFIDEIDKLDGASKKEASPYELAKERTRTFQYSKKIVTCSTPTLKTNYVWDIHEKAEVQKEFQVPCPHCEEYQVLDFHQIIIAEDKENKMTPEERADTAVYICPHCGCEITDREKIKAVRKGKWIANKGADKKHPETISFRMNCLNSRFLTFRDIMLQFLKSKDDPDKLQNFINSWLAEPWEDTKVKTSKDLIMDRQTDVPEFTVPNWAKMLTGGIDVQETSVYWSIRAWGNFITSQNIAHGQALSFNDAEMIMNNFYSKESGEKLNVELCLVDSGDQTDEVYEFCSYNADWAMPSKGASANMLSNFKISKINKENSRAYGMSLVIVDTAKYKDIIAQRMQRENGRGSWMVYRGCDEEYAKQVTSEHKVSVKNGKKTEKVWQQKTSHADNHYLDCEVYAFCAADIRGLRTMYLQNDEKTEVAPVQQEKHETPEENWIKNNESWV